MSEDWEIDDDDTEGNVFEYPNESSPMINRNNVVNSLSVSGTGRRRENLRKQVQSRANMTSRINPKFNMPCFTYHVKSNRSISKNYL